MASSDDEKVGGVKNLKNAEAVKKAGGVSEVDSVDKTAATERVVKTRPSKLQGTRVITSAEREKLFSMITEEADKMFESGVLPKEQKSIVETAVKQVIDASIIEEED